MRSGLSPLYPELYRDVEELLAERGLDISYETAPGAKVRPPDRATAAPASPWASDRSLSTMCWAPRTIARYAMTSRR